MRIEHLEQRIREMEERFMTARKKEDSKESVSCDVSVAAKGNQLLSLKSNTEFLKSRTYHTKKQPSLEKEVTEAPEIAFGEDGITFFDENAKEKFRKAQQRTMQKKNTTLTISQSGSP